MKKIIIPVLLLATSFGFAQTKQKNKADALFDSYQYTQAIEAYTSIVDNNKANQEVYRRLGDANYLLSQYSEAANWYAKLDSFQNTETLYRYAQSLKSKGDLTGAKSAMDKFAMQVPSDERAKVYRANPSYISDLQKENQNIKTSASTLNASGSSSFGAVLSSDDKVYFVSTRGSTRKDSWTNDNYLDIFEADYEQNGSYSSATALKALNSNYHDGPLTISSDGKTIYFARDGHADRKFKKEKSDKKRLKVGQQGIYKAVSEKGNWKIVEALPINSTEYSVTHPSLSADGKTLYFSSNMPGGSGESDIWKISINADGTYGQPVNLGERINTPGREVFPFIAEGNVLYFASDGHLGLGGLDIYKVNLDSNEAPVNLGNPINSNQDDFGYSSLGELIYFSSNREGIDRIYEALIDRFIDIELLIVDSEDNKPLADAEIIWESLAHSDKHDKSTTEANGKVVTSLDYDSAYKLTITKNSYEPQDYTLDINNGEASHIISMTKIKETPAEVEKVRNFQDIYFAFDSVVITEETKSYLTELISTLKEKAHLKVKLRAHTDNIGSAAYNLQLSERRAQATKDFLVSKGIDSSRVSVEGVGYSDPKVNCDGPCDRQSRSKNRRAQLLIIE